MKNKTFKIFTAILYLISLVILTFICLPLIKAFICGEPEIFTDYIHSFGGFSIIVMMFMQVAQIVVAFIPGELIEFVAGTLYGTFGGLFFCLLGIGIGQAIIFICVRLIGSDFANHGAGARMISKFSFLQSEKKLKTIAFILYLIPGTPKDLLTYIFPLTKIKFSDFIIITLFARIPSVLSSTLGGEAFADKNFIRLFVIYALIAIITLIGWLIYNISTRKNKD